MPSQSFMSSSPREKRSEGVVTFPSQSRASFRYRVTMKEERVSFWLEDMKTKKQWESIALRLNDIVSNGSVIPQATFLDYVTCFQDCLQETMSPSTSNNFVRDLVPLESDGWAMTFTLQIRVFASVWTPKYTIVLQPVPLEPLDLLAAKVRDQEDEIKTLQQEVAMLSTKVATEPKRMGFASAITNKSFTANQTLIWVRDPRIISSVDVVQFHASGGIKLLVTGVYAIHIVVKNNNTNNSTTFDLQHNAKVIAACIDSNANGHIHSSPMSQIVSVAKGDEFTIVYRGNSNTDYASIIIHQLQ